MLNPKNARTIIIIIQVVIDTEKRELSHPFSLELISLVIALDDTLLLPIDS
jgi:hypothetical protein